uniref:Uncharacterized protein n=1 Tax=Pavo cristatus TaxID=9049 RepID=A0A8C9LBB7_PAVCR
SCILPPPPCCGSVKPFCLFFFLPAFFSLIFRLTHTSRTEGLCDSPALEGVPPYRNKAAPFCAQKDAQPRSFVSAVPTLRTHSQHFWAKDGLGRQAVASFSLCG